MFEAEDARIPTAREWRKRRDQAGILIGYVFQTPKGSRLRSQAWRIFRQWQEEEITFKVAEKKLRELAAKAKA